MVDATSTATPLATAAGTASQETTDAFALLGNETRLAILLALWEDYDPHGSDTAVSFSRIFARIDYDDPGNLRYHLEKLEDQFVRHHADRGGYELRETGLQVVQSVIAGAGVLDTTRTTERIDEVCPFCDAPTTVSYRNGLVVWACTACDGSASGGTTGLISAVAYPPAGLADRSAEELRAVSMATARRQVNSLFDGLCPTCSGPVDAWLDCCVDHDPTGQCDRCGQRFASWARFVCGICKNASISSPKALALFHPAITAFYQDHGVPTRVRADDFEGAKRLFVLMDAHDMELIADDPPRVAVTASLDGDAVRVVFDESVRVAAVDR